MVATELRAMVGGGMYRKWSSGMPTNPSHACVAHCAWSCMADAGRPNIFCAAVDWGNKVHTINPQMVLSGTSDEVIRVKITMVRGLNHCAERRFVYVYTVYDY